jgi:predicted regulator of Ras-like GTPase activity (Roadblock/LC7/MglB family)
MTAWEQPLETDRDGFKGEVAGLGLSDVIQLNVQNRFSGCIAVQYRDSKGLLFFRDGQIIHAEEGERLGEEAFYAVLAWPAGQFGLQPNVTTTRCTIEKSCQHLLLEAHRLLDERRASEAAGRQHAGPEKRPPRSAGSSAVLERVRGISGVTNVVLQGKDGTRASDDGYEEEELAGQAAYLMMVGSQLGAAFRTGDLQRAAVQGTERHVLLLANKTHFLGVLIAPERELAAVEAEVKRALAGGR